MRTSASGLQSRIEVAIDQIFRFAPSIRAPIEPVVSSTNATSTTGLAAAGYAAVRANERAMTDNIRFMGSPVDMSQPPTAMLDRIRDFAAPELRRAVGATGVSFCLNDWSSSGLPEGPGALWVGA